VILFFGIIAALLMFFLYSHRIIRRREEARIAEIIAAKNARVLGSRSFEPDEIDLIDALSRYLKDPRKRYLVVTNSNAYFATLRSARSSGSENLECEKRLREKLGFRASPELTRVRTTRDLAEGSSVVFQSSDGARVSAVVTEQSQARFTAVVKKPIHMKQTALLYCQDGRDVLAFSVSVEALNGLTITMRHSQKVTRSQRRDYFRKRVAMPVEIRVSGQTHLDSVIVDLGGGGASLLGPAKRLTRGDDVELVFRPDGADWNVVGEVVRTSKGGTVSHIRFGHVSQAERDQLVGIIHTL
jgi:hypothetical protein